MNNPYESLATLPETELRPWRYVIAPLAGLVGYSALVVFLALVTSFTHGWSVALEHLRTVVRVHCELSLNTVAAFIPNLVLAALTANATKKWVDSDNSHSRWWILGCITIMGYVVVLYSMACWNLIPWTWSAELNNAVRSVLTLMFPFVAYVLAEFIGRRTK